MVSQFGTPNHKCLGSLRLFTYEAATEPPCEIRLSQFLRTRTLTAGHFLGIQIPGRRVIWLSRNSIHNDRQNHPSQERI